MEMVVGMQMKMNHVIMKHHSMHSEIAFHKKLCGSILLMNCVNVFKKKMLNTRFME